MKMRLDRWLATLGTGSRSETKAWIRGGEIAVNGRIILDSALSFDTEKDQLTLRGKPLDGRTVRHVMMHKPAGVLTAARDPKQPTVMDLLPEVYRSIGCMPVGRLDKDTTGILIFNRDITHIDHLKKYDEAGKKQGIKPILYKCVAQLSSENRISRQKMSSGRGDPFA